MADSPLGRPIERIDAVARVTGRAKYVAEFRPVGMLHAVFVDSDVPAGKITAVRDEMAKAAPGVRLILTHLNRPPLAPLPKGSPGGETRQVLQDDQILHYGQHLALVAADTFEQATYAASLLHFDIDRGSFDVTIRADDPRRLVPGGENDTKRGDAEAAFANALKRHEAVYTTPTEHHNPMETVATTAEWEGEKLHLFETTRNLKGLQTLLATCLQMPKENIHVQCPIVGGAFGSKGFFYGHILMTILAAKVLDRPVGLVTTRRQMFGTQGHRPRTIQQISLGANEDGNLLATRHISTNDTSTVSRFIEHCGLTTQKLYASKTLHTEHGHVPVALPGPIFMRAPGEAPGPFALESAMDELALVLGVDPVELRLRNDTAIDADTGKPWSIRNFRMCMQQAADRFGWAARNPKPRSMRAGRDLVGYGCAGVGYRANRSKSTVRATMRPDGSAIFQTAAHDVGPGTATVMAQIAADTLGVSLDKVRYVIGDSNFPPSPAAGGSQTAASVGNATVTAARALKEAVAKVEKIPHEGITVETGDDPHLDKDPYVYHSWGAVFAEVRVDEDLGTVRCARFVGVYDVGRVLNPRLVYSQLSGGIVWGLSMALREETLIDPRLGVYLNRDLSEYHVPVNADIPRIDVACLNIPDPHFGALGAHGVGEVGIAGTPGAIANAVYHATGKRVRDLPITLDKLL